MLEGLFNQIAGQMPPTVPPSPSQKPLGEPLQPRVYKHIPWVPQVRSEKYKNQNTQPFPEQDIQKIIEYLAAIGETDRKRLSAPPSTPTSFAAFCDFLTRRGYGRYIEMASAY